MHFAIYRTGKGYYYFRLLGDDFRVLCMSDPVPDKGTVYHAIEVIKLEASDAATLDFS